VSRGATGPERQAAPAREIAIVQRRLRERGHRWTAQRQLIAEVAFESHEHFTADELLAMCQKLDRSVSRATVYRTLAVLEQEGFVEGLDTGDGSRRFEHVLGHEHHDHMVCTACGRILEFRDDELEARQELAARRRGFRITSHSLKLFGLCSSCHRGRRKA
jgi:Fur family ferric uptake transcriptional regulator